MTTREGAARRDAESVLESRRALFDLPDDVVYLCGNSLGPLVRSVPDRVADVVRREWGAGLVGSWNSADWATLSSRVARRLAPLVGVRAEDVVVGDSTSVTLFKTMVAAARMRPGRSVIVVEPYRWSIVTGSAPASGCTAGGPGTIAKRRPRPVAALLASIAARRPEESMNVTPPRSSTTDR